MVLRIPLVLGLAHAMAVLPKLLRSPESPGGTRAAVLAVRAMAVLALVALALPWAQDRIAPREGVDAVPAYWHRVASYLAETDDGTVALEVPASAFGVYTWGNTHDDVLQGLAESPWAVRNVIPLAQPGNVVFLDAVTRTIESGHAQPDARAATWPPTASGKLVVRNDLDRFQTGAPDPAYVRSVLSQSDGHRAGPVVRADGRLARPTAYTGDDQVRLVDGQRHDRPRSARSTSTPSAAPATGDARHRSQGHRRRPRQRALVRRCGSLGARPRRCSPATPPARRQGQVLTDGTRRRETNFAAVRWNESATMGRTDPYRLFGPEHIHRFDPDQETRADHGRLDRRSRLGRREHVAGLRRRAGRRSRSARTPAPRSTATRRTAWRSNPPARPDRPVLAGDLRRSRPTSPSSRCRCLGTRSPVEQLALEAGGRRVVEDAPRPGARARTP